MSRRPEAYAVIVAGGSGSRMGATLPKQFLELLGKPVLYYSIQAFLDAISDVKIILVLPEQYLSLEASILNEFPKEASISVVTGGSTRYESVAAGLKSVPPSSVVLVHDGARPLVTPELIQCCYETASRQGSAIPVVPVNDSIRKVTGSDSAAIPRDDLRSVQTPQAFHSALLLNAFRQPYRDSFTDEASVIEHSGHSVHLIDGERSNLKITTADDLIIAEALLRKRKGE